MEPDLTGGGVDAIDAAHDPRTLGDLILHRAAGTVVQVEVVPAVALRHPDDFAAAVHVVAISLCRVTEERFRLLADEGARGARLRIDLDDAKHLMAALVVLEGDGAAVTAPQQLGLRIGVGE